MSNREVHAHPLVASTAVEMANSLYEDWAKDNAFFKRFPEGKGRRKFVKCVAPQLMNAARGALAQMLRGDYPESTKVQIYEALTADRTLMSGRTEQPIRAQ